MLDLSTDFSQERLSTGRSELIVAFKLVIKRNGRPRATDLHVRRLLCYVQAKDLEGTGFERSLNQLSKVLFLTVSTCRRVVRCAAKKFGLLTVIEQRHVPGGQTVNRYTINWKNVDAILCDENHEDAIVGRDKFQRSSGSPSSTLAPENTDMPVRLALPVGSSSCDPKQAQRLSGNSSLVPAGTTDELPVVKPPVNTPHESLFSTPIRPSGSDQGWILIGAHFDEPIYIDHAPPNRSSPIDSHSPVGLALDSHADAPVLYDHPPSPHLESVFVRLACTPLLSASNQTPTDKTSLLTKRLPPQIIRQNYASAPLMLPSPTNRLATTFKRLPPQINRLQRLCVLLPLR